MIPLRGLPDGEVHVYAIDLDEPPQAQSTLAAHLAADENERAARFHFDRDRNHFVVGRGALRVLLAGYVGRPPADIVLAEGVNGKPELAADPGRRRLGFNLSHSAGLAVYGFGWDRHIGIDVERVDREVEYRALAERFFAPAERAQLALVDDRKLAASFFACWTRKEAVIKAHGVGLSLPLDSFDVSIRPEDEDDLLHRPPQETVTAWRLVTLRPQSGFIGALAVDGAPWNLVWQDLGRGAR